MVLIQSGAFKLSGSFSACFRRLDSSLTEDLLRTRILIPRRGRYKPGWAESRNRKRPTQEALTAMDGMYGNGPYAKTWKSVRLALLSMQKYCAVINNYSANSDKMDAYMRELGALPISDLFRPQNAKKSQPIDIEYEEPSLTAPSTEIREIELSELPITAKLRALSRADVAEPKEPAEEEAPSEFVPASRVEPVEEDVDDPPVKVAPGSTHRHAIYSDWTYPQLPVYLKAYVFPRGDISRFLAPKTDLSGFADYYLMDAASLLPILALDLTLGDRILDLCAAPGGKSVAMLQTMLPGDLTCNDISTSRSQRLKRVLKTFCPMDSAALQATVRTTVRDGTELGWFEEEPYDRVLVDAPCTTDRVSLLVEENNMFTARRAGERNRMPQLQLDLLISACQNVKVGGTVVYSTCALSPMQNDGVVHLAIQELVRNDIRMVVIDTHPMVEALRGIFRFHFDEEPGYGQTVLPHIANNFGPMYFCKLRRLR